MTSARTVVFDLDGTLVDTAPDLINALNFVLEREGLPAVPLHAARNMIGAGARKLIERGLELDGRLVSSEDLTRLTSDLIDHYAAHIADFSRPFEGLESALDDLARSGYRFAVCTNKLEWLSKLLLDRLGLSARFAAICGADTFGVSKPDPAILREIVFHRHGRRRRSGYRRGAPRRRAGDRRRIWLYRCSDRRSQAGSADPTHGRTAGRRGSRDAATKFRLRY